jgi:hypothetical protein
MIGSSKVIPTFLYQSQYHHTYTCFIPAKNQPSTQYKDGRKLSKSTHNEYNSASTPRYERKRENESDRIPGPLGWVVCSEVHTGPTFTD